MPPVSPRTWTLTGSGGAWPDCVAEGHLGRNETVEVVEKIPVDAERERMLDMVQDLLAEYGGADGELIETATALLREHGRLRDDGGEQ